MIASFGSGNVPSSPTFIKVIKDAVDRGVILLNVSQCARNSEAHHTQLDRTQDASQVPHLSPTLLLHTGGSIKPYYATGVVLANAGAVAGEDMIVEAAFAKLTCLLVSLPQCLYAGANCNPHSSAPGPGSRPDA